MTNRRLYLAEWRKHYRISRATVAKRCGVDTYTVTRWENGKRRITAQRMNDYADALGMRNAGDLFRHPLEGAIAAHVAYLQNQRRAEQFQRRPLLTRIRDFLSAFFRKHQAKGA